jgi:hypothetical protein
LLALENQRLSNNLQDYVDTASRQLAYTQTQTNIDNQQAVNNLAVQNALFESTIAKTSASVNQVGADIQAEQQFSAANQAATNEALAVEGQALQQQQGLEQALGKLFADSGSSKNAIASILNAAASAGGVNEALSLLLDSTPDEVGRAIGNQNRQNQVGGESVAIAKGVEGATKALNTANLGAAKGASALASTQQQWSADKSAQDATFSQQLADTTFGLNRAINEGSYRIGVLSDQSSRASRDYLRSSNVDAVYRGAKLSDAATSAQMAQVRTPGFFDYLGVAAQGYNTFNAYSGKV